MVYSPQEKAQCMVNPVRDECSHFFKEVPAAGWTICEDTRQKTNQRVVRKIQGGRFEEEKEG